MYAQSKHKTIHLDVINQQSVVKNQFFVGISQSSVAISQIKSGLMPIISTNKQTKSSNSQVYI